MITHFQLFSTVISEQHNVLGRILQDTYIVQMFHNISWKSILCFDEHFNDLDKVVRTDIEDFNHPRKRPDKIKCHLVKLTFKLTSCLTKWKVGLVNLMASTLASHPLDKICPHGRQIPATHPWAPTPGTRRTDDSVGGERRGSDGAVGERQKNRYKLLHANTAATKAPKENSTILAVTTNNVPWESALVSLTTDWPRLLSSTQLTLLNFHLTNYKFFILLHWKIE